MLRWVIALCCLSGSAAALEVLPSDPIRLNPKQIAAVKSGVLAVLKDPESARFSAIRGARARKDGAIMTCGLVNAKNSYGGYSGNSLFVGVFQPGGQYEVLRLATDPDLIAETRELCAAHGLVEG